MKSVDFPQANVPLAKGQTEYQTLYVSVERTNPNFPMTMCFQLSKEEIEAIVRTGQLWMTQTTFGQGFQPISMSVMSPFPDNPEGLQPPKDENRTTADEWDNTHFYPYDHNLTPRHAAYYEVPCRNCAKKEADHHWSTRQCYLEHAETKQPIKFADACKDVPEIKEYECEPGQIKIPKDKDGPTVRNFPGNQITTCSGCNYYFRRLWKSGRDPIYTNSCTHPDCGQNKHTMFTMTGNLQVDHISKYAITPDWCPFKNKS